jgi:pimeloyl-ACP methyl ester carboxylesterase
LLAHVTSVQGFSRSFWDRPGSDAITELFATAIEKGYDMFLLDLASGLAADLEEEIELIRAPTLLIGGAEDFLTPVHAGATGIGMADIHERIAGSRLHVVADCGHFLSIEYPEETAELLLEWFSGDSA